ncbi:MAG: DUF6132 family protein [Bacteroidota bacterium]
MKRLFTPLYLIIIALGIAGGFAYYYYIGCSTGSCPLKSNPWIMMGYGGLIGYLAADLIQWIIDKKRPKEEEKE